MQYKIKFEQDIKADMTTAIDREEAIAIMEPLHIGEGSRMKKGQACRSAPCSQHLSR